MDSKKLVRRRRRSAVRRAWLYCLFMALPALIFATILLYQRDFTLVPSLLILGSLSIYLRAGRCRSH
jgi:two-component system nitrogen regulation sensor histidine kinase NtrY